MVTGCHSHLTMISFSRIMWNSKVCQSLFTITASPPTSAYLLNLALTGSVFPLLNAIQIQYLFLINYARFPSLFHVWLPLLLIHRKGFKLIQHGMDEHHHHRVLKPTPLFTYSSLLYQRGSDYVPWRERARHVWYERLEGSTYFMRFQSGSSWDMLTGCLFGRQCRYAANLIRVFDGRPLY